VDRVRQELDLFDYGNSDFYAYYDDTPPASTDMKEVYVSAYKHDNGSVLLVIANLSKDKVDRTGKVKINRNVLNVKAGTYINWPDRTPLKANGDEITLTVPKMGYRMIVLGNPPKVELPKIPFEQGWVLTNAAERFKGTKGSRLYHTDGNGLTFRGYLKNRMFMHENSHDLTTGKSVVITFNAKGKGKVSFGLFLNKDYGYGMHGQLWKELYLTSNEQQFRLVFPITKAGTVAVRELFSLAKDAEIVIRDYKLEILDSDKVVEVPAKQLPITQWSFANIEISKNKNQYLKVSGDSVELNGKKYLIYFNPAATKVTPGMFAEIRFKASGKGNIPVGVISYTDYKYSGAKTLYQTIKATAENKQYRIVIKITDPMVKQVRPMIIVPQGAQIKVSDYHFEIKNEVLDFSKLTKWTFSNAALSKEKDQLVKIDNDSIGFTGKKYFIYFDPAAIKVKPGTFVTIKFKTSGKGKASFGFFSYTDYKYGGFKVVSKPVVLTSDLKQNGIMFQITDKNVKQIRPLLIVPNGSELKVFDYQIEIK
jgi:plastocyanin